MNELVKELYKESYFLNKDLVRLRGQLNVSFRGLEALVVRCEEGDEERLPELLAECPQRQAKVESLCNLLRKNKRRLSKIKRRVFLVKVNLQRNVLTQRIILRNGGDTSVADTSVSDSYSGYSSSGRQEVEELDDMLRLLDSYEDKYDCMSSRSCTRLRVIKKRIDTLLKKSELVAQKRKAIRLEEEEQKKRELEEAKKHIY